MRLRLCVYGDLLRLSLRRLVLETAMARLLGLQWFAQLFLRLHLDDDASTSATETAAFPFQRIPGPGS